MRDTDPVRPCATHTAPPPKARPVGVCGTEIVRTSERALGSIRETVRSSSFATQTEPAPAAIASGRTPTGTWSITLFVLGSMTPTAFGLTVIAPADPVERIAATTAAAMRRSATAASARRRRPIGRPSGNWWRKGGNSAGNPSAASW